jgi:hypothetical protein
MDVKYCVTSNGKSSGIVRPQEAANETDDHIEKAKASGASKQDALVRAGFFTEVFMNFVLHRG